MKTKQLTEEDFEVRICKRCGNPFETPKKSMRREGIAYYPRVTCSEECKKITPPNKVTLICPICNISFETIEFDYHGYKRRATCSEECKAIYFKQRTKEPDAIIKFSRSNLSKPRKGEKTKIGPNHNRAKSGVLKSPSGEIYKFKNVTHFVRTHPNLFDTDALNWEFTSISSVTGEESRATGAKQCMAAKCLRLVLSPGSRTKSWRGWTGSYN